MSLKNEEYKQNHKNVLKEKLAYSSPELKEYGSIQDLTQAQGLSLPDNLQNPFEVSGDPV